LMYEAKGERASHIYLQRVHILDGAIVDMTDETPAPDDDEA